MTTPFSDAIIAGFICDVSWPPDSPQRQLSMFAVCSAPCFATSAMPVHSQHILKRTHRWLRQCEIYECSDQLKTMFILRCKKRHSRCSCSSRTQGEVTSCNHLAADFIINGQPGHAQEGSLSVLVTCSPFEFISAGLER